MIYKGGFFKKMNMKSSNGWFNGIMKSEKKMSIFTNTEKSEFQTLKESYCVLPA